MTQIIEGNILDIKEGIIVHQVNCQGSMGAGLAKHIKNKWPIVYETYKDTYHATGIKLGSIQVIPVVGDKLWVCNLAGQYGIRGFARNKPDTDYGAIRSGLAALRYWNRSRELSIYFPYGMGADLGGGDWDKVLEAIEEYFPNTIIIKPPDSGSNLNSKPVSVVNLCLDLTLN